MSDYVSDRHIRLQKLASDIAKPLGSYHHNLGVAWRTGTGTDENSAAIARGNAALDDLERVMRGFLEVVPDTDRARHAFYYQHSGQVEPLRATVRGMSDAELIREREHLRALSDVLDNELNGRRL